MTRVILVVVAGLIAQASCTSSSGKAWHNPSQHAETPTTAATSTATEVDRTVDAVRAIHGGAGPWAVAGYRMGEAALKKLGLPRGSFDLEVIHHTPNEVQYSCIADGAAAATGASLGKLNLSLEAAPAPETRTVYRRRSTGALVSYRMTANFKARFLDVPRDRLGEAGREAAALDDPEIFEVSPE